MYCTGCEEYKTSAYVKETNGVCPSHDRAYEKIEEENYFFRLSAYNDRIKDAIVSGAFEIIPKARGNEILSLLNEGLEDISISRKSDNVSWGIPVPGDETQTMYVWFEALMNYITTIGYPDQAKFKKYWPADVQVIGKDILRFHAAIWPGMLLGLGLPLPSKLFVHGFISSNGQKMSKSLGNVVDPLEVSQQYGLDAFRYYFLRHGPINEDTDFTWDKFKTVYNGELANELGNAVSRVVAMVMKYQNGVIGNLPISGHDVGRYEQALSDFRFDIALEEIWIHIQGVNQYIEEEKPWVIAKENDEKHLQEVLAYLCGSMLKIGELLVPFMPDTAETIARVFSGDLVKPLDSSLFPRIEKNTIVES
jgi:methionyl-tRNA synthetase